MNTGQTTVRGRAKIDTGRRNFRTRFRATALPKELLAHRAHLEHDVLVQGNRGANLKAIREAAAAFDAWIAEEKARFKRERKSARVVTPKSKKTPGRAA